MRAWLRDLRKKKGLTMKSVAATLNISEGYYCAIENGDRQKRMDAAMICGLAKAFEVEPAKILQCESQYMEGQALSDKRKNA